MAYIDFSAEPTLSHEPVVPVSFAPRAEAPARLSPLEWSVVAIARGDSLASLKQPGRISVALGGLFGARHNPRLADPRLESLRRIAVLAWHRGYAVAKSEVLRFVSAGYSVDHYELMMASISVAKMANPARKAA